MAWARICPAGVYNRLGATHTALRAYSVETRSRRLAPARLSLGVDAASPRVARWRALGTLARNVRCRVGAQRASALPASSGDAAMFDPPPSLQDCLNVLERLVTCGGCAKSRRRLKLSWLPALGCLLAVLATARVAAQGNDLGAPAGGRSTLMGNTGVALGHDGASPFNNPATIVRILDQRLAFAVNFYSLNFMHFDAWHQPGAIDSAQFGDRNLGGTALVDTNFESLPSTLCLFFTLEQVVRTLSLNEATAHEQLESGLRPTGKKLALCFATLESEDVDMQAVSFRGTTAAGPTTQIQSVQRRWVRTYIGPTYSISLSDRFAIGGSVHVVYSHDRFGINSLSLSSLLDGTGVTSTLSTGGRGKSFELTGTLGMTYRVDRFTLGASVRLPSLHVLGSYDATFSQTKTGQEDVSLLADATGSFSTTPPMRIAVGAGLTGKRWTLEVNAALSLPIQKLMTADLTVVNTTLAATGAELEQHREHYAIPGYVTINPSFGFEYFASAGLSILGGVATNFTTLGRLKPAPSVGNMIQSRVSHISASLGLGSYWERGEFLFGLQFDYGFGQTLAINPYVVPNDWAVVGARTYGLLFVIAGSTSFDSIVRVMDRIANGVGPKEKRMQIGVDGTVSAADDKPEPSERKGSQ